VVAVPYRDTAGRTRLPLVLEVDGPSLTAGSASPLKLEVYGYALDTDGGIRDVLASSPTLDLAKVGPDLRRRGLQVITSFALPSGPADLRFLVRDSASGRAGSLRVQVTVPSFEGSDIELSPPLFVDDPQARTVLPLHRAPIRSWKSRSGSATLPSPRMPCPLVRHAQRRSACWPGEGRESRRRASRRER
jgi:hypothetical protein